MQRVGIQSSLAPPTVSALLPFSPLIVTTVEASLAGFRTFLAVLVGEAGVGFFSGTASSLAVEAVETRRLDRRGPSGGISSPRSFAFRFAILWDLIERVLMITSYESDAGRLTLPLWSSVSPEQGSEV